MSTPGSLAVATQSLLLMSIFNENIFFLVLPFKNKICILFQGCTVCQKKKNMLCIPMLRESNSLCYTNYQKDFSGLCYTGDQSRGLQLCLPAFKATKCMRIVCPEPSLMARDDRQLLTPQRCGISLTKHLSPTGIEAIGTVEHPKVSSDIFVSCIKHKQ